MTSFLRSIYLSGLAVFLCAASAHADNVYTLQLQVDPSQESSMQRLTQLPKIHSATFSPSEHFVYLGKFDSEAEAKHALERVQRDIEPQISSFNPMIVELYLNQQDTLEALSMSRHKRLEEAPEALRAEPAEPHAALTPPIAATAAIASDYQAPAKADSSTAKNSKPEAVKTQKPRTSSPSQAENITVSEGYSIQIAVFKNQNNYRRFIDDHPSGDFYCNIDTSDSTVIHMGIYPRFSSAKQALKEAGDFGDLSPYIITLNNAELTKCR